MTNPFVESSSMKRDGMYQPAAKKARLVSSPKEISTPYSFTMADLQKCLFIASSVHPVNTQEILGKRKETACFCKYKSVM